MNADAKYVFSDGAKFRSLLDALLHLKNNPTLTVTHTEHQHDHTARLKAILDNNPYGTGR